MKRIEQERLGQPQRHVLPEVEEDIRRRAYELYEQRGVSGGSEVDDWLQAETEVLEKRKLSKAA